MRKLAVLIVFLGLIIGCSSSDDMEDEVTINTNTNNEIANNENNEMTNNENNEMTNNEEGMEEVSEGEVTDAFSMGDFVSAAHPTSGKAYISTDKSELIFKGFKTDNGPKLLVYLSTDIGAKEYVSLGDLKGIDGDFTYNIPEGTDVEKYNFVDIWCVDFSVSFGHAELK